MDCDLPGKHPSKAGALRKWPKERFRRTRKYESRLSEIEEWRTTFSLDKTHRLCFRDEPVSGNQYIRRKRTYSPLESENKNKLQIGMIFERAIRDLKRAHPEKPANLLDLSRSPDKLASMVHSYDTGTLRSFGGVDRIAEAVDVWINEGVESSDLSIRRKIYGINKHGENPSRSFLMFGWEALHDLTLIILIVCSVVSIALGLAAKGWPHGIYDGLGILLCILFFVTVTAVVDYNQSLLVNEHDEEKEEIYFQVTRDGCRQKVRSYELVVGDVVHLFIGDQVPADGIFISGLNLLIDESSLTGKSDPVHISEKKPFLFAGSIVQDGSATMLVTAVGMRTKWGDFMESSHKEGDETFLVLQAKVQDIPGLLEKFGAVFSLLTFVVLTGRFLFGKAMLKESSSWEISFWTNYTTVVASFAASVAKGLPLAVKLSLAFAMKKLRNDKARVRDLSACGAMAFCTSICTDKSGILTTNCMVVDKIFVSGETKDANDVSSAGLPENVSAVLLQGIFKCTGAEVLDDEDGKLSILGPPTEKAILQYGVDLGGDFTAIDSEIRMLKIDPFTPTKKKMSVIVTLPDDQTRAFCKGAPEVVLGLCDKMIDLGGEIVPMSKENMKLIMNVVDEFTADALRTLCLGYMDVEGSFGCEDAVPERGYTLVAVFGIKDPIRPGVKQAVETCLAAGIFVRMVTDDDINTAKVIAKQCGILTRGGLAAEGLDCQTENSFSFFARIQVMARSSSTLKYELVKNLKCMFEVVAVAGEGPIDAPALQESHIGFAMGVAGSEIAKGQADVVLMDDDFTTIVKVARWGRAVYVNIQKFAQFQFTMTSVAFLVNLNSVCRAGYSSLTTVQLLWANLIMGTLGALALATGLPNDSLMKRRPFKLTDDFITPRMWRNITGQNTYQMAVLFRLNSSRKTIMDLHGSNVDAIFDTFIFNTFVFCQVFNVINCRDIDKFDGFSGMFSSWIFMGVMISMVVSQVIIVELFGTFASTVPLGWKLWLLSIAIGLLSVLVSAVLKGYRFRQRSIRNQYHFGIRHINP